MLKRLLRNQRVRSALAPLAAGYLRFAYATTRWQVHDEDRLHAIMASDSPLIACFWHGRLMLPASCFPFKPRVHVLISLHRDGRLASRTISYLGLRTIDGSSSRRGAGALRDMARALRARDIVAITPDGPRGPHMRATVGAVALARMCGATVLPMACSVVRSTDAGSWDHMMVPFPFNRGSYRYGEPLTIPADADADALEAARLELERRLIAITEACDRDLGRKTPPQAPAATPA